MLSTEPNSGSMRPKRYAHRCARNNHQNGSAFSLNMMKQSLGKVPVSLRNYEPVTERKRSAHQSTWVGTTGPPETTQGPPRDLQKTFRKRFGAQKAY